MYYERQVLIMKTKTCIIKQRVSGQERKVIAAVLGEVLETPVIYAGVPSCAYEVAGWTISKEGFLISPPFDAEDAPELKTVMDALRIAGVSADEKLEVQILAEGTDEAALFNLEKILKSKETLLRKSLDAQGEIAPRLEAGRIVFGFFKGTINKDQISACALLSIRIWKLAQVLKRVVAKEQAADNEKYAFRCFLLRLGFIGGQYRMERKVLLSRLAGNMAFKEVPGGTA